MNTTFIITFAVFLTVKGEAVWMSPCVTSYHYYDNECIIRGYIIASIS